MPVLERIRGVRSTDYVPPTETCQVFCDIPVTVNLLKMRKKETILLSFSYMGHSTTILHLCTKIVLYIFFCFHLNVHLKNIKRDWNIM